MMCVGAFIVFARQNAHRLDADHSKEPHKCFVSNRVVLDNLPSIFAIRIRLTPVIRNNNKMNAYTNTYISNSI